MKQQVDLQRLKQGLLQKSQEHQRSKLQQQKLLILHLQQVLVQSKLWLKQLKLPD